MTVDLRHGDNLKVLPTLPDCSVDSIVTDPPYGLTFMGRAWDASVPVDIWTECLRVLKPGGHLLAFGGSRTWHRQAVAIEDAGFEIRDSITWLYGSGFPKSLDVGKAIDKLDATAERRARALEFTAWIRSTGLTAQQIDAATGTNMGGHYTTPASQPAVATADLFDLLRPLLPKVPERIEQLVAQRTVESQNYARRPITQHATAELRTGDVISFDQRSSTERERRDIPATDAARQWQGWGTALKPASEPIVVARKPLSGTVAATVLEHGTGAMNVDACRVGTEVRSFTPKGIRPGTGNYIGDEWAPVSELKTVGGRWPANVVLTHGEACADVCVDGCPVAELDAQSGTTTTSKPGAVKRQRAHSTDAMAGTLGMVDRAEVAYGDQGGASRFFPTFRYQAKAPTSERPKIDGQGWPTVKPLALMRWLVRLVTPPGGLVLDPFAGTGPTLQAAELEGFDSLGVELDPHAYALACQRLGIETAA